MTPASNGSDIPDRPALCSSAADKGHGQLDPLTFAARFDETEYRTLPESDCVSPWSTDTPNWGLGTQIHEQVHWWQLVGTPSGLAHLLVDTGQLQLNLHLLPKLHPQFLVKPLVGALREGVTVAPPMDTAIAEKVVGNWFDVEFGYRLLLRPEMHALYCDTRYFKSFPLSVERLYCSVFGTIGQYFDIPGLRLNDIPHLLKLPADYHWSGRFPRVGSLKIMEGQARMQELQYMHLCSRMSLGWDEFRARGYMGDRYTQAFHDYITEIGVEYPRTPLSNIVFMFLLLCEIAMSPALGYTRKMDSSEDPMRDISPGSRFEEGCRIVRDNPHLIDALGRCHRETYRNVAQVICEKRGWPRPDIVAGEIVDIVQKCGWMEEFEEVDKTGAYGTEMTPLRLAFVKHVKLMRDKQEFPHFFCWPALYLTSIPEHPPDLSTSMALYRRHSPPFGYKDGNLEWGTNAAGGWDRSNAINTARGFVGAMIVGYLHEQWIRKKGDFTFIHNGISNTVDWRDTFAKTVESAFQCELSDIRPLLESEPPEPHQPPH